MRTLLWAVLSIVWTLLAVPAGAADARPATQENGVSILPLSDFEEGERMWTGYDNIERIILTPSEPGPAGYYDLGTVHAPYRGHWYRRSDGHRFAADHVKSGKQSLAWTGTMTSSRIVGSDFPKDWSAYGFLSLWIYAEKDNFAALELVCYSENPDTSEDDYFKKEIVVNWKGWRFIEVPFDDFSPTRSPVGWQRIDYIKLASTGWSHTALADTAVHLDDLKLSSVSIAPDPLAEVPLDLPSRTHPFLFGGREVYAKAREKARSLPWAAAGLAAVLREAEGLLAEGLRVPDTGGGFYHDVDNADEYAITEEHYRYSRGARTLAVASHLAGDARYGSAAKGLLLEYARKYLTYALHDKYGNTGPTATTGGRATAQAINEAKWIIALAWAYDLTYDLFLPAERDAVEQGLFRPCAELLFLNNEGKHNHQAWYNAGVGVIGFLLRDARYVKHAIHGPDSGFLFQLRASLTEEGMWYEGSGHYHFYTMEPLLALSEAAWFAGYSFYEDRRYRSYFSLPVLYADPLGGLPTINDGRRVVLTEPDRARFLEIAFSRTRLPAVAGVLSRTGRTGLEALLYGAEDLSGAASAKPGSVLLGGSLAVLRSPSPSVGELYATVNGRPYTGGHSHYDKLSLTLATASRILSPDPGSIKYRDPMQEGYFMQTAAHNTVSRDAVRQEWTGASEVTGFAEGPLARFVGFHDAAAYPGTRMEREVLLADRWVLDLFSVASSLPRDYRWSYRNEGLLHLPPTAAAAGSPLLPRTGGFTYLEKPRFAAVERDTELVWEMSAGERLRLLLANPGVKTDLIAVEAPFAALVGDEVDPRRHDDVFLGRRTASTTFAAILVPEAAGGGGDRIEVTALEPGGSFKDAVERRGAWRLRCGEVEDLVYFNTGAAVDAAIEGLETDARLVLVRRAAGRVTEAFVRGASYLRLGREGSFVFGPDIPGLRTPDSLVHLSFKTAEVIVENDGRQRIRVGLAGSSARLRSGDQLSSGEAVLVVNPDPSGDPR